MKDSIIAKIFEMTGELIEIIEIDNSVKLQIKYKEESLIITKSQFIEYKKCLGTYQVNLQDDLISRIISKLTLNISYSKE
jgi:hypothetical protein